MSENEMKVQSWSKPEIEEIPLSCEITTYSNAELPPEVPVGEPSFL